MYQYFIKTPRLVKYLFPSFVWNISTKQKEVYLSFDDGPHPEITPFVLSTLRQYNALATFFCIGKNVLQYPNVYQQVIAEGHAIGNHTHQHVNGWKTPKEIYYNDIAEAAKYIDSNLFRPPYGKITLSQAKGVHQAMGTRHSKIIMWDVLSGDFDQTISKEKCLENVCTNYCEGSIIVFHDSEKAYKNLAFALPAALKEMSEMGYKFCRL